MRMVLIGDLQYQLGEEREILQSFAQLRALAPDLAVSMGDMGAPRELGRERGMSACAQLLKVLRRPVFALLGNHDVEYPPDAPLSGRLSGVLQCALWRTPAMESVRMERLLSPMPFY